jgi:hypothetical protein
MNKTNSILRHPKTGTYGFHDSRTFYTWLLLSLGIHCIAIISANQPSFKPKSKVKTTLSSIRLNVVDTTPVGQHTTSRSSETPSDAADKENQRHEIASRALRAPGSYAKLLPSQNWLPDHPAAGETRTDRAKISPSLLTDKTKIGRYYGLEGQRVTPETEKNLDFFATHIVIPVLWRTFAEEAKAEAILSINSSEDLLLESLFGEPMLRAILYDALTKRRNIDPIYSGLRMRKISRYKVILRFKPENEKPAGLGLSIAAFSDGMVITKLLPQVMKQFPGMPLDDEESRRGKRREQAQISKLMESAAFRHPIRDMKLVDRQ